MGNLLQLFLEEIKRGGTGSATNKAFERYFQPRRAEYVKVVSTTKELQNKQAGKNVKMRNEKMLSG
jgi:hypothetical protein